MILIYLFTKKNVNLFSSSDLVQFHLYSIFFKKNNYLHSWLLKELLTKFQVDNKNDFYLLLLENNEFLQFY